MAAILEEAENFMNTVRQNGRFTGRKCLLILIIVFWLMMNTVYSVNADDYDTRFLGDDGPIVRLHLYRRNLPLTLKAMPSAFSDFGLLYNQM